MLEELAAEGRFGRVDLDAHRQISLPYSLDDGRDVFLVGRQIVEELIDGHQVLAPLPARARDAHAALATPLHPDRLSHRRGLVGERVGVLGQLVEGLGDLAIEAGEIIGESAVELSAADRAQTCQEFAFAEGGGGSLGGGLRHGSQSSSKLFSPARARRRSSADTGLTR